MAKQKPNPASGLARFNLTAMLGALLGILLCSGLLFFLVTGGANSAHNDAASRQQAQSIAAVLDARYSDMRATLTLQAAAPSVISAMTAASAEIRSNLATSIQNAIPFATRVELIPRGAAQVDLGAEIPINFVALDLIRRAESQEFVGPESSANARDVIYTAAPVSNETGVIGVLFVAYSANYLQNALSGLDPTLGLAQIEQAVDKAAPAVVLEYGSGSKALVDLKTPLAAPTWTLSFSGANNAQVTGVMDLAIPIALALTFVLGAIWLAFTRLQSAMQEDADALTEYGSKVLTGHVGSREHFQISHFQNIATKLGDALGDSGGAVTQRSPGRKHAKNNQVAATKDSNDVDSTSAISESAEAAKASAAAAALLAAEESDAPAQEPEDDFLDLGDDVDDDFDLSATGNETGSFMRTDLPIVEEQEAPDDELDLDTTDSNTTPDLEFDPGIFRAYDIRGIVKTNLSAEVVYWIGRAFADEARSAGQSQAVVGRDGRLSSPELAQQLIQGLLDGGMDAIDIGQVATPMLYFATHKLNTGTGIMITGSHNPPEYNGLKMMIGGTTLAEERITALHHRLTQGDLHEADVPGELSAVVIDNDYMDRILDDVAVAQSLKIVVDCGNGVAGGIAPLLLQELGCEIIPLYCEVDGTFPNHHPDPADPKNLEDLITVVKAEKADLGIAFDGDGDRIGVVTDEGAIIWPDKLMMLFARDIVGRNPGADIIYDVKCSRHLNNLISEYGGRPIMWKTGHSHMKAKLKETGALLAGEFSGHVAFGERWYGFDDAIYTAARLLEIIGGDTSSMTEVFAEFPSTESTPEIQIETTESTKFKIIENLAANGDFGDGTLTSIDGVRVDYANGWGLVRASNTSPKLTLRFEADTTEALDEVQNRFRTELEKVHSSLRF